MEHQQQQATPPSPSVTSRSPTPSTSHSPSPSHQQESITIKVIVPSSSVSKTVRLPVKIKVKELHDILAKKLATLSNSHQHTYEDYGFYWHSDSGPLWLSESSSLRAYNFKANVSVEFKKRISPSPVGIPVTQNTKSKSKKEKKKTSPEPAIAKSEGTIQQSQPLPGGEIPRIVAVRKMSAWVSSRPGSLYDQKKEIGKEVNGQLKRERSQSAVLPRTEQEAMVQAARFTSPSLFSSSEPFPISPLSSPRFDKQEHEDSPRLGDPPSPLTSPRLREPPSPRLREPPSPRVHEQPSPLTSPRRQKPPSPTPSHPHPPSPGTLRDPPSPTPAHSHPPSPATSPRLSSVSSSSLHDLDDLIDIFDDMVDETLNAHGQHSDEERMLEEYHANIEHEDLLEEADILGQLSPRFTYHSSPSDTPPLSRKRPQSHASTRGPSHYRQQPSPSRPFVHSTPGTPESHLGRDEEAHKMPGLRGASTKKEMTTNNISVRLGTVSSLLEDVVEGIEAGNMDNNLIKHYVNSALSIIRTMT
eukprot:Phypoly_transcript_07064.p1 GENE.Phypoly_transcript_07064~~Phypoly_transcript_07064.p1  ORF type:complete len:541 (-),score=123.61 Phypoly_transcript_07064:71-1654(-)